MRQENIPLKSLVLSKMNVRKDLEAGQEDSGIDDLASSIKEKGLLSPLIVRPAGKKGYEVVVGQRRFLACKRIGLNSVFCLVRDDLSDVDAVTLSLIENVHRADMNPLDKARSLKSLYDKYDSYEKVAAETAWSSSTVRKYIRLLDLPPVLRDKIGTKDGPAGVTSLARLATTFEEDETEEVYDRISGFKQTIQEEILKRSQGDISKIDELVDEAVEGAFDKRTCGGQFKCEIIREVIQGNLKQADFQKIVRDVADNIDSEIKKSELRDASRNFWKVLARR